MINAMYIYVRIKENLTQQQDEGLTILTKNDLTTNEIKKIFITCHNDVSFLRKKSYITWQC